MNDARRDSLLDAWDDLLVRWPGSDAHAHAVAETVGRTGYAQADVESQLRHVVDRSCATVLRELVDLELGGPEALVDAPGSVLVLASGRIPGLAIEGVAAGLAVGARVLVRPSGDETVLHHLLAGLSASHPDLAEQVQVVAADGGEPPWDDADAAVVFGSDETVALVRRKLGAESASRVAGYGSRQGIAVVTPGAATERGWASRLADDVLAFRQAGCMSPAWLFVVAPGGLGAALVDAVGRELAHARPRHLAAGVDDRVEQRRATDADVLGAIAAGMAPDATALYAGDARLTVVHVKDLDELDDGVRRLGTLLQTAVLATGERERDSIGELVCTAGVTRTCLPGRAHRPDPLWPQDGLGRLAPLLGRRVD